MIRRKLNNEKCGCCCTLKEKLQYLWDHTMGAIKKVNEITPDGDGKFTVEAGTNIALTEISNGLRIDTTGGVSYYTAGDTYVDVDNNDLEISLKNPGQTDGVALHNDLEVVATGLTNLLNGGNVGSDTKPIKIVNGVATPVTDDLIKKSSLFFSQGSTITTGSSYVYYGFVDTTTRVFITINLPKLLDRPFTLSITSMEVKGVNGSFTLSSNPISTIATNNQTPDTIRVAVTFTNAHGLTVNTPISGFLTYTLTVN